MSHSRCRLFRAAWLITVLAVIAGELLPGGSLPLRELAFLHISDKVEHFAAYAVLAFLPALHESPRTVVLAAVAGVVLGVLLEFGQRLTATRCFETADMAANALGVCAGVALALPLRHLLR
jgi:VanZ family protein